MTLFQRFISMFRTDRSRSLKSTLEVADFRSAEDRRIAEGATQQKIASSVEDIVDRLLSIEEASGIILHPTERKQCGTCSKYRSPRHDLQLSGGVLRCLDCGKVQVLADYLERPPGVFVLVHKEVVAIGEELNSRGGIPAMKEVVARWMVRAPAGEFAVREGCKSNLSMAWHGIGKWLH